MGDPRSYQGQVAVGVGPEDLPPPRDFRDLVRRGSSARSEEADALCIAARGYLSSPWQTGPVGVLPEGGEQSMVSMSVIGRGPAGPRAVLFLVEAEG